MRLNPALCLLLMTAPAAAQSDFQIVDQIGRATHTTLLVGDVDFDRRAEIVLRSDQGILFYKDDGTGQFSRVHVIADPGYLLALGDVDGDDLADLFFEREGLFVRWESSSPFGYPDHEVWTTPKHGHFVDFKACIADVDADGLRELVTTDATGGGASSIEVYESAPNDQMTSIASLILAGGTPGNPVVADFDLDGRQEIVVAGLNAGLNVFEGIANDTIVWTGTHDHSLGGALHVALVDAASPDGRPILFLAGFNGGFDYRALGFEMLADNALTQVSNTLVASCSNSGNPQIAAADLFGTPTNEIVLTRTCGLVRVFSVGVGGALTSFDSQMVSNALHLAATDQTAAHLGAIAVARAPSAGNPLGLTAILEIP